MYKELTEIAIYAAKKAGEIILAHYKKDNIKLIKQDGSPFTDADKRSDEVINEILFKTNYTIVSEERKNLYLDHNEYWIIDPLDGTKDYLLGNNEFTVNIALIKNKRPVLGIIYAPALDEFYIGAENNKIRFIKSNSEVFLNKYKKKNDLTKMLTSRHHNDDRIKIFIRKNNISLTKKMGSALKYARIAVGEYDVYPRLVGSSEWDTAAGQIILEATGGSLLDWNNLKPNLYGKKNRRNGRLIALNNNYKFSDFEFETYPLELL